jgi:pimeloyl-ACP methyl ester carboxylesterase
MSEIGERPGASQADTPAPIVITTTRGRIEYAVSGAGPVVLALHGAMGGYDQSLLLAKTIGPSDFRVVAVSRPGYLGTPLDSGRRPDAQADLCAALLDSLGVAQAAVLAISGGGPCALQFALRHRQRCWGLVLVSTCGGPVTTPIPLHFQLMAWLARCPGVGAILQRQVQRDLEQAARRSIPDPTLRAQTLQDPTTGPLFRALLASTADQMARRLPGTLNDIQITRTTAYPLEQIRVPALIVHGTADQMVPYVEHAEPLAQRIPGAELCAIAGGEHMAIFTHRDTIQRRVAAFLARHVPGPASP